MKKKGAGYFVTIKLDDLHKAPAFERYLRKNYILLKDTSELFIADLTRKKRGVLP